MHFKIRALKQIQGGMTEIATVPTHEEEKELYGIIAASKGMQPVRVEVKIFNGIWMNWTTILRLPEPN